ncbi:MAG TPA: septal ring lytic transglycosylase RlpA family protein [Longimicrobiales bacterium]
MSRRVIVNLAGTAFLAASCAANTPASVTPDPVPQIAGAVRGTTDAPVVTASPERITPEPARVPAPLEEVEGEATYYASKFEGRRAASGIVFRNSEPYAAHRTYPFGTLVRVTSLVNDRSVLVRIVDRGPHGSSARARRTIIDLSQSAARELDFLRAGRIPVRVEVLEWGPDRK